MVKRWLNFWGLDRARLKAFTARHRLNTADASLFDKDACKLRECGVIRTSPSLK
jgi:hypothetical protein